MGAAYSILLRLVKDRNLSFAGTGVRPLASFSSLNPNHNRSDSFAERVGLPRSTLPFWKARKDAINLDLHLVDFFESPVGLDLLYGIVVALHLVFELDAGCGLRKICRFWELTGLDRFVASSYGEQQKVAVQLQEAEQRRAEQTVHQMRKTAEQLRCQREACLQQCPESQLADGLRQQIAQAEQAQRDAETAWENCKDQEQRLAESATRSQ